MIKLKSETTFFVFDKNRGMTTNAGGLKEEIALNDIQNVLEEPVK